MFSQRQQEILNVSVQLISEKGIQNLTIKNISSAIGVTERALYRHFKSKQQILESILLMFVSTKDNLYQKIENIDNSVLEKIDLILKMQYENFLKHPHFATLLFSEEMFRNDAKLAKKSVEIMNSSMSIMQDYIKKGQNAGEIRTDISAIELAQIVLGSIRLSVLRWHIENYKTDIILEGKKIRKTIRKILKK